MLTSRKEEPSSDSQFILPPTERHNSRGVNSLTHRYLRELGYTEGVLEARARVKNIRSFPEVPLAESEVVFLSQERQENQPEEFKVCLLLLLLLFNV